MKFDELDAKMRVFETSHDYFVVPGIYVVVRLDGRGFTKLTKERHAFDKPFDARVRDLMLATTEHLMTCGLRVVYGYTQSDEISLLLHRDCDGFNRKSRKLVSVLAGEASARFSVSLGDVACFDARLCELPDARRVVDYFRWRSEDAARNALNAHCNWTLRGESMAERAASERLLGLSVSDKHELLFARGVNINDLPAWQKRGSGVRWAEVPKQGVNPVTGETVTVTRRALTRDLELPARDAYDAYLRDRVAEATPAE